MSQNQPKLTVKNIAPNEGRFLLSPRSCSLKDKATASYAVNLGSIPSRSTPPCRPQFRQKPIREEFNAKSQRNCPVHSKH